MKCEGCGIEPTGEYGLHDYCEFCSGNYCDACMASRKCRSRDATNGKHRPAEHGGEEGA